MNGLVIRSPWVEMILDGRKIWEIRGRNTRVRGKIALIRSGSGLIVGTCQLVDVVGPLTRVEFRRNRRRAGLMEAQAKSLPYPTTYAWVLTDVRKYRRPRAFKFPAGAVVWVRLRDF